MSPLGACFSAPVVMVDDQEGSRPHRGRPVPEMVFMTGLPREVEQGIEQLTPLDHSAILDCINPKAFWFPSPGLQGPRLKASLGKLLNAYPLLAGRISVNGGGLWSKAPRERLAYCISLCNAGAEFLELPDPLGRSMSHFPLGAMIRTGFTHMGPPTLPDYFSPMDIDELLAGREPVLKVRLTQLTCGGCILALTLAHAIQDGHSAAMFLNDWAKTYRHEGQPKINFLATSLADPAAEAAAAATAAVDSLLKANTPSQTGQTAAPSMDRSMLLLNPANPQSTASSRRAAQPLACLALQQLPKASWSAAVRCTSQLVKEVREQDALWPGSRNDLSSLVLHLPVEQVAGLKALAASGRPDISTNDAVAGLVWTLMCHLRGRPLPGRAPPGSPHCMGLAVDLRRNGLSGTLPLNLFANATWCLHVPIQSAEVATLPVGTGPAMSKQPFVEALRHGASKVRASLQEFRSQGPASGWEVVDHSARLRQAPLSAQLQLACNVITGQDAMLSSWQFPYWAADFGAGGPLRYLGALHPTPPWSAAVMAAHPSQGGMYLFLVVPSSARGALRSSAVLAELVPGATFA